MLGQIADIFTYCPRLFADIVAAYIDLTMCGRDKTSYDFHGSGLTRSVGAEKT